MVHRIKRIIACAVSQSGDFAWLTKKILLELNACCFSFRGRISPKQHKLALWLKGGTFPFWLQLQVYIYIYSLRSLRDAQRDTIGGFERFLLLFSAVDVER